MSGQSRFTLHRGGVLCWIAVLLCTLIGFTAFGLQPKNSSTVLEGKAFFKPELYISTSNERLSAVLHELDNRGAWQQFQTATADPVSGPLPVFIDPRSGTATTIIGSFPVIPGNGYGNRMTLDDLGARIGGRVSVVTTSAVRASVLQLLADHQQVLGIDLGQLGDAIVSEVHDELWQVSIPQQFEGVPVRHGRALVTINNGNAVLMGTETWGNVFGLSTVPELTAERALDLGFAYVGSRSRDDIVVARPGLEIVPFAPPEHQVGEGFGGPVGQGIGHYLVWAFAFVRPPEGEVWEVLVDAHSGEVISLQDTNHYDNNEIVGGVYPVTSTEICPTDDTCGEMQSGWPMPFADTGLPAPNNFTNSAGLVGGSNPGTVTTTLSGDFININDNCGGVNNSGAGGIDLGGVNGQHNCTTGGGSSGNTPASRTAFYELNKLVEQAIGWLPNNNWLNNQTLTANLNINNSCNAFWNGSTINFYRSGGGCRNTGELAAVFDHEWGHGLDDNDSIGSLSNTSEAYADIAAIYRLQASCVGHGFFETINDGCGQTADGTGFNVNEAQTGPAVCATDCSGVRDADFALHSPATPATALGFVCPSCLTSSGPCGRQVHCSAAPPRQAAWDLVARDLPAAGFDNNSSFIIGNRLFYQGSGNIGLWYSCTCGSSSSGCGSASGYLQWLAADDNDGNINNGTPHMEQIFDAYDRHGIACSSPSPVNSGCSSPSTPPTLAVNGGENSASLSWNGVAGASEYWVFRTEGHAGCDFGKALIAEVSGTSFTDTEVAGGREYYYTVVAAGTSSACFTGASNCVNVTPTMPGAGAPTVTITNPADGSSFGDGDNINFTGTAIDPQDGDISGSIVWNSSIDGNFGSGASVNTSTLSIGSHTITASATDSDTLTGTDQISISILPGCDTVVYTAGFETDSDGWTTGPGQNCSTGTFVRGTPTEIINGGVTTQAAGAAAGSFAWFTQPNTAAGTDDVDGGTCESLSPVINVGSEVSVFASYFHGQRDAGDDAADGFSLELIDANTSAVILTLASFGDVTNNAVWTAVSDATASAPSQVRLRVRATDGTADGDLVEAAVDAIQVCSGGCENDSECDDGDFCNGAEVCNAGSCEAGTPPNCDDGVSCTVDSCNETTDSCDNTPNDGLCDNGLFCDGSETCDAISGCQSGTAPNCDDGVGCTVDSCNEGTDSCDNVPNDAACDDGAFCNGAEFCDPALDCQDGPDPCEAALCDEANDVCNECDEDLDCDDGAFCNGAETCVGGACQAGSDPCPGQSCDEANDECIDGGACSHSTDFESGANGWIDNTNGPGGPADPCSTGFFVVGTPDATTWQVGGGNPGQAFFTQPNPGGIGTDDTDNGTCEALSPTVDCNGQDAAEVTLDYFHGQRDAGDDANDGFTIEVLNDGVVVDTIVNIGDVTNNPAWTTVSTTVANPGNIQVRVRSTDATGAGDIVEGGIDNVTVAPGTPPPPCTVDDDFEAGAPDWINDPASTCTTGDYVTGNPTNAAGGFQIVGSNSGVTSIFTATNTSAGVNDVDGGNCILSSPSFAVANTSTLSVWYWHGQRDAGDDAAGDFFILEYSTNGGVSWNTLASNGDSTSNPVWTNATAAIPAASNVQLRMQCSDGAGPGDLVECGIDDFSICE